MSLYEKILNNLKDCVNTIIIEEELTRRYPNINSDCIVLSYFKDDEVDISELNKYIKNTFVFFSSRKLLPINRPSTISITPFIDEIDKFKKYSEKEWSKSSTGQIEKFFYEAIEFVQNLSKHTTSTSEIKDRIKQNYNDLGLLIYYLTKKGFSIEITYDKFFLGDIILRDIEGNKIIGDVKYVNSFGEKNNACELSSDVYKKIFGGMLQIASYYIKNVLENKYENIKNIGLLVILSGNSKYISEFKLVVFRIGYVLIEYLKKYNERVETFLSNFP